MPAQSSDFLQANRAEKVNQIIELWLTQFQTRTGNFDSICSTTEIESMDLRMKLKGNEERTTKLPSII